MIRVELPELTCSPNGGRTVELTLSQARALQRVVSHVRTYGGGAATIVGDALGALGLVEMEFTTDENWQGFYTSGTSPARRLWRPTAFGLLVALELERRPAAAPRRVTHSRGQNGGAACDHRREAGPFADESALVTCRTCRAWLKVSA